MKENLNDLKRKLKRRKGGKMIDIDGVKRIFETGQYVLQPSCLYPDKVFIFEEICRKWRSKDEKGKEQKLFRLGYYIIGKKPRFRGKWVYGQYNPFITKKDMNKLMKKAKRNKMI